MPAFPGAREMRLHPTGFREVQAVAGLPGWPARLAERCGRLVRAFDPCVEIILSCENA